MIWQTHDISRLPAAAAQPLKPGIRAAWAVFAVAVLAVAIHAAVAATQNAVHPAWIAFWSVSIALLVAVPRLPLTGMAVFVMLAYGVPRYGAEADVLLQLRLLDWVCVLTLTGWLINMCHEHSWPVLHSKLTFIMFAFVAWVFISLGAALASGNSWKPEPQHDPVQFAQALLMFLLASRFLGGRVAAWSFALVLAIALTIRALVQGAAGMYLEGDIALLAVVALPLTALGGWIAPHPTLRVVFGGLALHMVYMVGAAQNRAAAVAAAAALLAAWWNSRYKWRLLAFGAPLLIAVVLVLSPQTYIDRFSVIWDRDASHRTAHLDKATIDERLELWDAGWRMVQDAPWLGVGAGNYPRFVRLYLSEKYAGLGAHNNFIQVAAETGIPGLFLYTTLFLGALLLAQQIIRRSGGAWPKPAARLVQPALAAYLAGGFFITRHDMVLAYILVGWIIALHAQPFPKGVPRQARRKGHYPGVTAHAANELKEPVS